MFDSKGCKSCTNRIWSDDPAEQEVAWKSSLHRCYSCRAGWALYIGFDSSPTPSSRHQRNHVRVPHSMNSASWSVAIAGLKVCSQTARKTGLRSSTGRRATPTGTFSQGRPILLHATLRSRCMSSQSHTGSRRSESIPLYGSVALAAISAIALAISARDPLLTEAGTRHEEKKQGTKYFRLKDIKAHGAESRDGVWVSRGIGYSLMLR